MHGGLRAIECAAARWARHASRAAACCVPHFCIHRPPQACVRARLTGAAPAAPSPFRYDDYAFDRITESAFGRNARAGRLEKVTFLRMGDLMFDNWDAFSRFLNRMHCKQL